MINVFPATQLGVIIALIGMFVMAGLAIGAAFIGNSLEYKKSLKWRFIAVFFMVLCVYCEVSGMNVGDELKKQKTEIQE